MGTAIKYIIFAIIDTLANIGSQDISIRIYTGDFSLITSVVVGTAVGLFVKYVLDKVYIFQYQVTDIAHDSRTFALYTIMGIITTIIFWGFEFGFNHIFQTKAMRYTGGVIGLAIGYYIKYQLDKRFVFVQRDIQT